MNSIISSPVRKHLSLPISLVVLALTSSHSFDWWNVSLIILILAKSIRNPLLIIKVMLINLYQCCQYVTTGLQSWSRCCIQSKIWPSANWSKSVQNCFKSNLKHIIMLNVVIICYNIYATFRFNSRKIQWATSDEWRIPQPMSSLSWIVIWLERRF